MNATTKSVQAAWADVMGAVRSLGKDSRNQQQGFNFRGVDDTLNAVGPALRDHGVSVVPTGVHDVQVSTYTTKSGTVMRDVFLVVDYLITGPAGDTMPGCAAGEASDAGDKATPKAMSVAYRTFLLEALTLPTCEPDPDSQVYERSNAPTDQEVAQRTADGLTDTTDPAAVQRVQAWAEQRGVMDLQVTDQAGNSLPLRELFANTLGALGGAA